MLKYSLPENQLHVSWLYAFEVDDSVAIFVLVRITGKDWGKISGADRQNKLVSVEIDIAAGQRHVGQDLSPTKLLGRAKEDGMVIIPL